MNQMVEVTAESIIIKDPDFSEIIKDIFDTKKTIRKQFAEA